MSINRMIIYAQNAHALTEATMKDLLNDADDLRTFRSKLLRHYYKDVTVSKDGNAIANFSIPSGEKNKSYDVHIEFIPLKGTLFSLASGVKTSAQKIALLKNSDVKVFCTCPDFNWSGMKYNMKHIYDSYLSGYESEAGVPKGGEDIPPKVRDKQNKNKICKHIIAAFKAVLTNWSSILSDVKKMRPSNVITNNPKVQFQDNPD